MAYLKSASDIAAAIGATVGGSSSVHNDPKFHAMLAGSTARICRMLGTPLLYAGYVDTFLLPQRFTRNTEKLRLTAGFVNPVGLVVTAPNGNPVNSVDFLLDSRLGVITLLRPVEGRYSVRYNAGFQTDNDDPDLFANTPEWLQSIAIQAALIWFRTVALNPKASENVSYSQMMNVVYRELAASVYGTYDRPRSPARFPEGYTESEPHSDGA